eukprot:NODE_221_length_12388_cov_2.350883.p2 type:complete len:643 gc:universal NODE_221_length_12388_cov_2.350883:10296-8368(-)
MLRTISTTGPLITAFTAANHAVLVSETELQFVDEQGIKNTIANNDNFCFCSSKSRIFVANDTEIELFHLEGDLEKILAKENAKIRAMDCYGEDCLIYSFGTTLKKFDMTSNKILSVEIKNIAISLKVSPNGKYFALGDKNGVLSIFSMDNLEIVSQHNTFVTFDIDQNKRFPFAWTPMNGLIVGGLSALNYIDSKFNNLAEIEYSSIIRDLCVSNDKIYICSLFHVTVLDFKTHQELAKYDIDEAVAICVVNKSVFVAIKSGGATILPLQIEQNQAQEPPANFTEVEAQEDFDTQDVGAVDPVTQTDAYHEMFADNNGNEGEDGQGDDLNDFLEEDENDLRPTGGKVTLKDVKDALEELTVNQEPFQSGTTPYVGTKRFLAFNLSGKVSKVKRDDGSFITGDYHNKTKKPLRYADLNDYEMADISDDGLYMLRLEEPFELAFHDPDRASGNDWTITLDSEPQAIAAFNGGVAICLSSLKVYVFDYSGVTTHVFALEGRCISLCAYQSKIFAIFADFLGNTCYSYVDTDKSRVIKHGQIPILGANILFSSFSYYGNPVIYDSNGCLQMLSEGNLWVPILDLRGREVYNEYYIWPVGVSSERFHFVACPVFFINLDGDAIPSGPRCNSNICRARDERVFHRSTV